MSTDYNKLLVGLVGELHFQLGRAQQIVFHSNSWFFRLIIMSNYYVVRAFRYENLI